MAQSIFKQLFLAGLAFIATTTQAQVVDPQNVLIKNVILVASDEQDEDAVVNILIVDNKLSVVTQDDIPITKSGTSVDARNGFLLGELIIGSAPSIVILDEDPRSNVLMLVDTGPHAVFALDNGELIRNTLIQLIEDEPDPEIEEKRTGWIAYSPPPLMLPLSYKDGNKWNQWSSKYVNGIFVGLVALDRQHWLSQDDESLQQVGDMSDFDGGFIRGLRYGAVGTLNFDKPWVYTVFIATTAFDRGFDAARGDDSFVLFDYRLDIPISDNITMSVGKQKEPISMERLMPLINLPIQERAAVNDAMLASRNVGVVFSGSGASERMTWAGGLFNDWFDQGQSVSESSSQVVGRVTWLPYISNDESNLVHLGFGARYSNGKEGLRYRSEPEFAEAPLYVDTGNPFPADSSMQYVFETSWRRGPYWLAGEWIRTDANAPASGDPTLTGYSLTGSWALTGETRPYNRDNGLMRPLPVAKSVYQGGWGAWELSMRYSDIDLTDGLIAGGDMEVLSLGVNWWLSPIFNANLNYRHVWLDRFGVRGTSSGLNARIMIALE